MSLCCGVSAVISVSWHRDSGRRTIALDIGSCTTVEAVVDELRRVFDVPSYQVWDLLSVEWTSMQCSRHVL